MARATRSSEEKIREEVGADLTPMIDVTFQLLIFFMLTLKFKALDGMLPTLLPPDRGFRSDPALLEPEAVEVRLSVVEEDRALPAGRRRVRIATNGGREIGVVGGGPAGRADEDVVRRLASRLAAVRAAAGSEAEKLKAMIHAAPDVPHDDVVSALNAVVAAGFRDVSYAGIPSGLVADLVAGRVTNAERR